MKLRAIGRKWTYWYGTEQGYQQVQLPLCKTFRSGASPTVGRTKMLLDQQLIRFACLNKHRKHVLHEN
jgi:hypothetical protein